jgi:hypothetical protein
MPKVGYFELRDLVQLNMPPETKITINLLPYIFGISFVCHQKPHGRLCGPNQIYGNLVTQIPKS